MKNSGEAWDVKHAKNLDFSRKNGIFRAPEKVGENELSPLLSASCGFDSRRGRLKKAVMIGRECYVINRFFSFNAMKKSGLMKGKKKPHYGRNVILLL